MADLTKPTGSLINNIYANSKQVVPIVGMGATMLMFSDRHAGTIVEVLKKSKGEVKGFVWQQDNAKRIDKNGMSESQQYEYSANIDGPKYEVILRKNGRYVRKGESLNGTSFALDSRMEYYDFSR